MKRLLFQSIFVLCLIAAFSLASCNRMEDDPDNAQEIQQPAEIAFTATLAPKGENPQTKAISSGIDDDGKEILNVAWAEGEQVAVYYQKTDDSYATATAIVGTPNGDGSAPITATLTDAKGGTAKFVYPATLANTTGDIDEAALLSQNGNLTGANGISTKFDAATGEGTITVSGSEASVSGTVTMTNRVCICKFHFDIVESAGGASGPELEFSPVIIRDGNGHTYTITSDRQGDFSTRGFKRSDDIYIALLPVSGKTVSFYTKCSNHYLFTASNTTLTAGKFYRNLSIDMVKDNSGQGDKYRDLRDGSITANDGDIIYQRVNTSATDKTITIPDGATVTLAGVNISATGSAGIICSGNATINLEGANSVTTSANEYPAIQVGPTGKTLTIQGTGSINAQGGMEGAGIGSGYREGCGNIIINSGSVTATGGIRAAGIGCGYRLSTNTSCGNITICGGSIMATGGQNAAAIGSGQWGICGNITITDGVNCVTANKSAKTSGPYSIGKGYENEYRNSTCGTITIGGTVYYDGSAFRNGGDAYLANSPLTYQP